MTNEDNVVATTPAEEVNKPEETVTPEPAKEETVEQVLGVKKESDAIPKARLDKEIQKRKELERQIIELQERAKTDHLSKAEVNTDLKALAEEHNVDAGFLNKLATAIRAEAKADLEETLRPITEKEKRERIDSAFQAGFSKAMENLPEYQGIVNPSVIKTLSLDPQNANKTFRQLVEETYGNALGGRKTIERAVPRGGNASGELDYDRAKRDEDYFREVMKDPQLKKQYNDRLFGGN